MIAVISAVYSPAAINVLPSLIITVNDNSSLFTVFVTVGLRTNSEPLYVNTTVFQLNSIVFCSTVNVPGTNVIS